MRANSYSTAALQLLIGEAEAIMNVRMRTIVRSKQNTHKPSVFRVKKSIKHLVFYRYMYTQYTSITSPRVVPTTTQCSYMNGPSPVNIRGMVCSCTRFSIAASIGKVFESSVTRVVVTRRTDRISADQTYTDRERFD